MPILILLLAGAEPEVALKGFQKTTWGMSESQVEALYPGGRWTRTKGSAFYDLRDFDFAGFKSKLSFFFVAGKGLEYVMVTVSEGDKNAICAALESSLSEKYGPGRSLQEWASEKLVTKLKPDEPGEKRIAWWNDVAELKLTCRLSRSGQLEAGVILSYGTATKQELKARKEDL